jgi:DHA2 family multidrug resistance protein
MAAEPDSAPPLLPRGPRIVVTFALALALFMNILDVSIANVSIPTIAGFLGVSADQGTWVITSFAVANAVTVPISGWLSRQIGEVKLFTLCTLLFSLFSWLCGLSFTFPMLLVCRALQGAVAGPMIPLSQSLLLANYPREQRGFANGIFGMTAVVAPVAGPILGGFITDSLNWSWIFYINIPFGLIAAWLTWVLLRKRETPIRRQRLDVIGLGLLIVGVGCLQVMLDQGNDKGWFGSGHIVMLGLGALVALAFFVAWELTDDKPIVDLHLFARRNFTVATVVMALGYMTFFGAVVILPLWLQTQMGYTATWAGLATASFGILGFVFSPIVGRLADKMDLRLLVTFGFLVFAAVSWIVGHTTTQITFGQIFMQRLAWGIGTACFFIPLITLSLTGLHGSEIASASGLFNFIRQLALGFGTSISVTLWDRRASFHDHRLTTHLGAHNAAAHYWLAELHGLGLATSQAWGRLTHMISRQAFMLATNDVFWASTWVFLILSGLVWISRPNARG